ncbi:unnamed protein product [Parnassius apollo]|uniref:(apollo) hypothetical protein n=1 Tax=Parnassius apollo TaxID=110799 RepID=A0A8S3W7V9_PARAO|nr:unnamed protein product [Parnassius apollo]
MCKSITIILSVLMVCANGRYLIQEHYRSPYVFVEDGRNIRAYNLEESLSQDPQEYNLSRVRRQAHGVLSSNPDGTSNFMANVPLTLDDKNMLSAVGTVSGASGKGDFKAAGGGLAWDNVNGHGASLTGQHIPDFGDQLTAAAKLNLLHSDKHDVTAQAFATRSFPSNPNIPNFDTYGGKVGYTYDNKLGASLGMQHTDLFKKTDYSAMGNYNLFKGRDSSLDFNAVLIVCDNGRYLIKEFVEDGRNVRVYDLEEIFSKYPQEFSDENNLSRVRRQAHGTLRSNPDGTSNFMAKVPLTVDDKNMLSAIGTVSGASGNGDFKAAGGGLA